MKTQAVRIIGITIQNFKNVKFGNISFENPRKNYRASVLGLYGQNGSGKTALIDAIELLKNTLCGRQIPNNFADYINTNSSSATITYNFHVKLSNSTYNVSYEINFCSIIDDSEQTSQKKVKILRETIKCPIITGNKQVKIGRLIDTGSDDVFIPKAKMVLLVGKDKKILTDLMVSKKLAAASSRSFVFSKDLFTAIQNKLKLANDSESLKYEISFYTSLIEALAEYGNGGIFVINTRNAGLISLNAQPLMFKYEDANLGVIGHITILLDSPRAIDKKTKDVVEKVIANMNIVLKQIIPGLTIAIRDLGMQVTQNGDNGNLIQLMSLRNGTEIALKYESEGIKKIISILQLLIVVYNQSSITVAIDELDSGVFEYLLGETLRIISEKGKGQLIFTSHNLRPLETLDKGFIAFTTTNPENRYTRLTNVKGNNNLRDCYYRNIMLGEQNEELYETTREAEIAFAFREAGEYSGK